MDGFSHRIDDILVTIFNKMSNFPVNNDAFNIAKDIYRRTLVGELVTQPCGLADVELILFETKYSPALLLDVVEGMENITTF